MPHVKITAEVVADPMRDDHLEIVISRPRVPDGQTVDALHEAADEAVERASAAVRAIQHVG